MSSQKYEKGENFARKKSPTGCTGLLATSIFMKYKNDFNHNVRNKTGVIYFHQGICFNKNPNKTKQPGPNSRLNKAERNLFKVFWLLIIAQNLQRAGICKHRGRVGNWEQVRWVWLYIQSFLSILQDAAKVPDLTQTGDVVVQCQCSSSLT